MQQEVELSPTLLQSREDLGDLLIAPNIELESENVAEFGGGLLDPVLHRFTLVGERTLHPRAR
jgi:hypothetical protein